MFVLYTASFNYYEFVYKVQSQWLSLLPHTVYIVITILTSDALENSVHFLGVLLYTDSLYNKFKIQVSNDLNKTTAKICVHSK